MNFIKYISCGIFLLFIVSDFTSANVRLCGKSLSQFLDMVCVHGFNAKNLNAKKSVPLIDSNESGVENGIQPLLYTSLFMGRIYTDHNRLMAETHRPRFDGVADECCRQSCAMSELLSYCL